MKHVTRSRILKAVGLLVVGLALVAWADLGNESPAMGTTSHNWQSTGVKTNAELVQWLASEISAINGNGLREYFDQTADCTADSPTGDKLWVQWMGTNIPNDGAWTSNDCDGPKPNVNEEVELDMRSCCTLTAGVNYHYIIQWKCNGVPTSVDSDVNFTFELGTSGPKYWIAKAEYLNGNCV